MNITRHLYLTTAVRAPDDPAAAVVDPVDPVAVDPAAVDPAVDPAAVVDPVEPAAVDPVAVDPPAPALHGNAGKSPWYMKELAERTAKISEQRTAREAAEQRAADLQAIIERMQADPAAAPAARTATPAAPAAPGDFQAAVKAQAAHDRFVADTVDVRNAGLADFPDFGQSLDILGAIGATTNDDFVADVIAVDKAGAHKIFDKLAKDPEKAASLVGMDSRRRIVELTRMADAPKTEVKSSVPAVPAPPISRAPAPRPSVSPLAPAAEVDPMTPDGDAKMSDKQWETWMKGELAKKRA